MPYYFPSFLISLDIPTSGCCRKLQVLCFVFPQVETRTCCWVDSSWLRYIALFLCVEAAVVGMSFSGKEESLKEIFFNKRVTRRLCHCN